MKRAVFLDRDGVINKLIVDKTYHRSPRAFHEFSYNDGIQEFVRQVQENNYQVVIITNQPEVKRKLVTKEIVDKIHEKIRYDLGIINIYTCWHDNEDNCNCRKPKPGLFTQAAQELDIQLTSSYMVGDREKDMIAAANAGCSGILYKNYTEKSSVIYPTYSNFEDILKHIINRQSCSLI